MICRRTLIAAGLLGASLLVGPAAVAAETIAYTPAAFDAAAQKIRGLPVNVAGGSKFLDKSDLWAVDGQLNLSNVLEFSDKVDVLIGGQWKQWDLNSKGTIFNDIYAPIKVNETGGFIQLKKGLLKFTWL